MSRYRFVVPVLLSLGAVAGPSAAFGQVAIGVNITIAPPELPVYVQPPIPAPGYIWTPGYWAYGPDGYYWVPGTWVQPPTVGLLWTPGWWGWNNGAYLFNDGYWGPQVGFYGGINYGYGYGGVGYQGGYWNHGAFFYNRTVNNISNVHITNIYNRTVINNTTTHVSFNGGHGGIATRPTAQQEAFAHAQHTPPTPLQMQHRQAASSNHDLLATVNHGRPPIAATARPAAFSGPGVVPARNAAAPEHGAPGPAITHPTGGTAATPGAAPALRSPAEATRPGTPPHEGPATPEVRPPTPEAHGAPIPVHPEAGPQVRPAPEQHLQAAPAPHPEASPAPHPEPAPIPHPQPAPAPHPEAAPAPHPQPTPAPHPEAAPAPQQHEEKKPPG
jgi:hypothetical protein